MLSGSPSIFASRDNTVTTSSKVRSHVRVSTVVRLMSTGRRYSSWNLSGLWKARTKITPDYSAFLDNPRRFATLVRASTRLPTATNYQLQQITNSSSARREPLVCLVWTDYREAVNLSTMHSRRSVTLVRYTREKSACPVTLGQGP